LLSTSTCQACLGTEPAAGDELTKVGCALLLPGYFGTPTGGAGAGAGDGSVVAAEIRK